MKRSENRLVSAPRLDHLQNLWLSVAHELKSKSWAALLSRSIQGLDFFPLSELFSRVDALLSLSGHQNAWNPPLGHWELPVELQDPLLECSLHIVRNFIEHGVRRGAKRLSLSVEHRSQQLVVTWANDGRGPDLEEIRARAVSQKLLPLEWVSRLDEGQLLELLFRPGFSTLQQATEGSGRGMGLDIVQEGLKRCGGRATARMNADRGFEVVLEFPVDRVGCEVRAVTCGNQRFDLPVQLIHRLESGPPVSRLWVRLDDGQNVLWKIDSISEQELAYCRKLELSLGAYGPDAKWVGPWLDEQGGYGLGRVDPQGLRVLLDSQSLSAMLDHEQRVKS